MKTRSGTNLLPIVYLIFGIYFLNYGFQFMKLPEFVLGINQWIIALGGVILLIAFLRSILYSKGRIIRQMARSTRY